MKNNDKKKKQNPHKGHRQRMRDRFETAGDLSSFSEHEVIEMLLYPFIPMKNTNEIAHELLKTFFSLNNILNAEPKELEAVSGISHSAAVSISFLKEMFIYAHTKSLENLNISNKTVFEDRLKMIFKGERTEVLKAVCIDESMRVQKVETISKGSSVSTEADIRQIARTVLNSDCPYVILAHNHPDKECFLSNRDIVTTNKMISALSGLGIKLLDHYIVSYDNIISMTGNGVIAAQL